MSFGTPQDRKRAHRQQCVQAELPLSGMTVRSRPVAVEAWIRRQLPVPDARRRLDRASVRDATDLRTYGVRRRSCGSGPHAINSSHYVASFARRLVRGDFCRVAPLESEGIRLSAGGELETSQAEVPPTRFDGRSEQPGGRASGRSPAPGMGVVAPRQRQVTCHKDEWHGRYNLSVDRGNRLRALYMASE
jgi:hypothetical protein